MCASQPNLLFPLQITNYSFLGATGEVHSRLQVSPRLAIWTNTSLKAEVPHTEEFQLLWKLFVSGNHISVNLIDLGLLGIYELARKFLMFVMNGYVLFDVVIALRNR